MNDENNIPTIELKIKTIEVKSEVRKTRLTRRNTFFTGISGKIICLYYWMKYRREKEKMSLKDWLDQPIAYRVELPDAVYCDASIDVEKELEHYLIDEIGREEKQN